MAHDKGKALIAQLRDVLSVLEPYDDITGRTARLRRQALLREAAEAIAGTPGGANSLLRDVTGVNNVTAVRLCARYDLMVASNGASQSLSRGQREWAVNSISLLTPDASSSQIARMCSAGKRLCRSAESFASTGEPIYYAPASDYPGRKRLAASQDIADAWIDASAETSRTTADGTAVRAIQGGNARVARAISASKGCSMTTAYKYRPDNITLARKKTDLCSFCEGLRQVRRELVHAAIAAGAELTAPPQDAGQRDVADVGDRAVDFCRGLDVQPPGLPKLLDQYSALKWHEDMNVALEREMRDDFTRHPTVIFDYSSNVALSSLRGDTAEFFRKKSLSLFGAMVTKPRPSGGHSAFYVNVFSTTRSHTSRFAAAALKVALSTAMEHGAMPEDPDRICLYADKARHFVSRELAYEALLRLAPRCDDVSLTYHACHHGKTPLDAHFSHLKRAVDAIPVEKWPSDVSQIRSLVSDGVKHLGNSATVFLRDEDMPLHGRKRLLLQDIACVQRLRAVRSHNGGKMFTVEGKATQIRVQDLAGENDEEEAVHEATELDGGCSANIDSLCAKIEKQRKKRQRYTR